MMNKKAQEGLPLTVIIAAIIVIVVLILVVTFFLGGFGSLTVKIKELFFGGITGSSETLAIQSCQRYCETLQLKDDPLASLSTSNYCKVRDDIDLNGDGVINPNEKGVTCKTTLGVGCKFTKNGVDYDINC